MSLSLPELIAQFVREEVPAFVNARDAWALCDATSDRFIRYCADRGLGGLKRYSFEANVTSPAQLRQYRGPDYRGPDQVNPAPDIYIVCDEFKNPLMNEYGLPMCGWHCIVDAGECLIDFTSRQYQTETHRMEFPLIIPMNRAMAAHA